MGVRGVRILGALVLVLIGGCGGQSSSTGLTATPSPAPTVPSQPAAPNEGLGSSTHAGDAQFCFTHACIANFPNGNGTVVQCADRQWSHSGGLPGACSDHGGETGKTGTTPTHPTSYPGTVTGTDSAGHNIGIDCSDNPADPRRGCNDGNGRGPADNLSYGSVTGTNSRGYMTGVGCSDDPNDPLPRCLNGPPNGGGGGTGGGGSFCSTHTCIPNFWNGHGSIVPCVDGEWSHSGGVPGACSHHGGEAKSPGSPTPGSPSAPSGPSQSVGALTSDGAVVALDGGSVYSVDAADQSTVSSWSSGDPISVSASDDQLTNLSTGENATATSVGSSSDANVYANTGDHTQQTSSADGRIVVLDDGSIWEVTAADQATSSVWTDASSITVNENSASTGYDLVNTDDQSTVQANYIGNE